MSVEEDSARRELASMNFGSRVPAFAQLNDLLDQQREAVDAVAICSPNDQHHLQAIAAAHAGLHVFCEKPMALTLADGQAMVAAAKQADVKLMVGHKRWPDRRSARSAIIRIRSR